VAASVDSEGLEINLTPLLDLVLQLIMFFIITVNFVRADQFDESIQLPVVLDKEAKPPDNTADKWVFLNLNYEGKLIGVAENYVLDTPGKLKAYLERTRLNYEAEAREKGTTGEIRIVVLLRADKRCKYEDVFTCIYSCQQAGFKHWQLRVMMQKGKTSPVTP
jgi:biopolymer transport protein ExbD